MSTNSSEVPGSTIVRVAPVTPAVKTRLWARVERFQKVTVIGPAARTVISAGSKASVSPGAVLIVTLTAVAGVAVDIVRTVTPRTRSARRMPPNN